MATGSKLILSWKRSGDVICHDGSELCKYGLHDEVGGKVLDGFPCALTEDLDLESEENAQN